MIITLTVCALAESKPDHTQISLSHSNPNALTELRSLHVAKNTSRKLSRTSVELAVYEGYSQSWQMYIDFKPADFGAKARNGQS